MVVSVRWWTGNCWKTACFGGFQTSVDVLGRENGAPRGIRTPDLCLRRAALYPAELWAHKAMGRADSAWLRRGMIPMGAGRVHHAHDLRKVFLPV